MRKQLIMLIATLLIGGCGRAPEVPPPAPEAQEADAPARPDPPDAPPPAPEPEPLIEPHPEPPVPAEPGADPELAARNALLVITYLERQAQFFEAFTALRDLSIAYPQYRTLLGINDGMQRLRRHRENAVQITTALDRFDSYTPRQLTVVQRQFANVADTAELLLSREVREADDTRAGQALTLLQELAPAATAGAAAERLLHHPETTLRQVCLDHVAAAPGALDTDGLTALYHAAVARGTHPDGADLRRLSAAAAARAGPAVTELAQRGMLFETAPELAAAALPVLGMIYHFQTSRSDDAFAALLDESGLTPEELRAAAQRIADSGDPGKATLGRRASTLLTPVDIGELDAGQAGRWTFGSVRWPLLRADIETEQETDSISVSQAEIGYILNESYTFAAWLNPTNHPTGSQPTPFSCVMRNQAWSMGLLLDTAGFVYFLHVSPDSEELTHCRSATPVALDTWVHAAITRDTEAGRMMLYLDGKPVAETAFTPTAESRSAEPDDTRPFRLLDLPHDEEPDATGARFLGEAEDLRLYRKALSAEAVEQLARLGQIW